MEINSLNDSELGAVTGGSGGNGRGQRFKVGDKVSLMAYPQYGVGIVKYVYCEQEGTEWKCSVAFDAGTVDALEDEFIPA